MWADAYAIIGLMDALIILGAIGVITLLLALVFRVSGVFLFLSVAVGYLLMTYIGDDAGLVLGMVVKTGKVNIIAQFIVMLAPVVLSLFFLKRTLPKHKILLHLPLLVASSLSLVALSLPLLDSSMQGKVFANSYGSILREYQDIFVSVSAILALLIMWMTYRHKEGKKHNKLR